MSCCEEKASSLMLLPRRAFIIKAVLSSDSICERTSAYGTESEDRQSTTLTTRLAQMAMLVPIRAPADHSSKNWLPGKGGGQRRLLAVPSLTMLLSWRTADV